MANVMYVADFFINVFGEESDMTHLKLQKLLYYAQGVHLARIGTPLFDDPIEAWKHGPVVSSVYGKYSQCGYEVIHPTGANVDSEFSNEEVEVLVDVAREKGQFSAWELRNQTHCPNTPWSNVYTPNKNNEITRDEMREYFSSQEIIEPFEIDFSQRKVIGYLNDDGITVLPDEYDDDEDWSEYV